MQKKALNLIKTANNSLTSSIWLKKNIWNKIFKINPESMNIPVIGL